MANVSSFNFGFSKEHVPYSGDFATFASKLKRNGKIKKQHTEPVRVSEVLRKHGTSCEIARAMLQTVQVVANKTEDLCLTSASGSGYYAGRRDGDDVFLTNRHVIEEMRKIDESLNESAVIYPYFNGDKLELNGLKIKDTAVSQDHDLGLFVVNPEGQHRSSIVPSFNQTPLTFSHRDLEIGEQVSGLGFLNGDELRLLPGKVLIPPAGSKNGLKEEWVNLSGDEMFEHWQNKEFTLRELARNVVQSTILTGFDQDAVQGLGDIPFKFRNTIMIEGRSGKGVSGGPLFDKKSKVIGTLSVSRDYSSIPVSIRGKIARWISGLPLNDITTHAIAAKDTTDFLDSQGVEYNLA